MEPERAEAGADLEASWVRRIAEGDRSAFEELYRAYQVRLFRYLFRMVGEAARAEELANDVMFEVWKGAGRFKGASKPSTWLFGIAHHKALNALRGRRIAMTELESTQQVSDPKEGMEERVARDDTRRSIQSALASLSAEHRSVIELTFYHCLSYQEIAEIMKCPLNTVKTRMFHAKKRLREILERMGIASELA